MHPAYRDLVFARAAQAVDAARATQSITNGGLKGSLREIVVRDLLEPLLPPEYVVGSGQIISAWAKTSGQTHIVVCDRRVLPPVLFRHADGVFPIETVIATVEVKSRLDATELKAAHDAAGKIARLSHAPPVGEARHSSGRGIEHVIPFLFAFGTDLSRGGKTELERYEELCRGNAPALRTLCVVERGCWVWDAAWSDFACAGTYGEVVALAAALVNVCQRVARTRLQPNIRDYLDRDMGQV